MSARRFLQRWLVLLGICLAVLALFNALVDVYGTFGSALGRKLLPWRARSGSRITRAEMVRHRRCQVALLGTSRTNDGFDAHHPAFRGRRVCNIGLAGAHGVELEGALELLLEVGEVEEVWFLVELFGFSGSRTPHPDFAHSRFDPDLVRSDYLLSHLIGWRATRDSLATFGARMRDSRAPHDASGQRAFPWARRRFVAERRLRQRLGHVLRSPSIYRDFEYAPEEVERLRGMVERARAAGLAVEVLLTPDHAVVHEMLRRAGITDSIPRWKRDLVEQIVVPGLARVWDFSTMEQTRQRLAGRNPPARRPHQCERYPSVRGGSGSGSAAGARGGPAGDTAARGPTPGGLVAALPLAHRVETVPLWWDAHHFTWSVGDALIETVTGTGRAGRPLEPDNVAREVERQRATHWAWLATNPADLALLPRSLRPLAARE